MANDSYIQGVPINFYIDLTDLGTFSDVMFEIYVPSNKMAVITAKYLNPTSSQLQVTRNGTIYSFSITSDQTEVMLGDYKIELTYYNSGGEIIDKIQSDNTIIITQEAK